MPADIANLSQCRVFDENAKPTELGTLWAEKNALLIFLRHFACIACRAHATEMWAARKNFQDDSTRIIFIGNGTPNYIKKFREDLDLKDALIFTDPSLLSFRLAGFQRGFLASHGPSSMKNVVKMFANGHIQKMPFNGAGDLWQLGGSLIVSPTGEILHHYISEAMGDFAPALDLEKALTDSATAKHE